MKRLSFKFKPGFRLVPMDVYGRSVLFCFGMSHEGVGNVLAEEITCVSDADREAWRDAYEEGVSYHARCLVLPSNHVVVHLVETPADTPDLGTLAHEIYHAADCFLRGLGMRAGDDSCEAFAYLVGFLTCQIFECYRA